MNPNPTWKHCAFRITNQFGYEQYCPNKAITGIGTPRAACAEHHEQVNAQMDQWEKSLQGLAPVDRKRRLNTAERLRQAVRQSPTAKKPIRRKP